MSKFVIKKLYYPLIDYLKGEHLFSYLRYLEMSQYFPPERLTEIQFYRFKKLLNHVYAVSPFYQRALKARNLTPNDFTSLNELELLPIITKTDIRDNIADFLDKTYRGKIYSGRTSGSTGIPLQLYHTPDYSSWDWASRWRARRWFGTDYGDREVALWGRPVNSAWERHWGSFKSRLRNVLLLSGFNLSESDLMHYWKKIRRFHPDYFYGYASSLAQFGRFVKEKISPAERIKLKAIFSAGETLFILDKNILSDVFSCKVSNEYGCSEVGAFAYECPFGNWHISVENVIVEFIDEHGKPSDKGEITVTCLTNFYMPLIRYRIGDQGMHISENCPCGRKLPLMKLTAARIVDVVKTRSGKVFSSNLFDYINDALIDKGIKGIKQFRIIQNDFEIFTIQIVRDESVNNAALIYIENKMREYLGTEIQVKFEFLPNIPQDPTGKIRSFISKIE